MKLGNDRLALHTVYAVWKEHYLDHKRVMDLNEHLSKHHEKHKGTLDRSIQNLGSKGMAYRTSGRCTS